jgi:hypothetical protein
MRTRGRRSEAVYTFEVGMKSIILARHPEQSLSCLRVLPVIRTQDAFQTMILSTPPVNTPAVMRLFRCDQSRGLELPVSRQRHTVHHAQYNKNKHKVERVTAKTVNNIAFMAEGVRSPYRLLKLKNSLLCSLDDASSLAIIASFPR